MFEKLQISVLPLEMVNIRCDLKLNNLYLLCEQQSLFAHPRCFPRTKVAVGGRSIRAKQVASIAFRVVNHCSSDWVSPPPTARTLLLGSGPIVL